jgi:hypothetical protein
MHLNVPQTVIDNFLVCDKLKPQQIKNAQSQSNQKVIMPTNLYDAHRQWALRPPDERFSSIEVLQIHTEVRKNASLETQMALKRINLRVLPGGAIVMNGNTSFAHLSHWAFGQLCYLTRAPAKYLRILPAELAQNCLSYELGRSNQRCKLPLPTKNPPIGGPKI